MSERSLFDQPIPEEHLRSLELMAQKCTTHHRACSCREWAWTQERKRLEAEIERLKAELSG